MGWLDALEIVGAVCLSLVVLLVVVLLIRRYVINSHGGVFDCGMRPWKDGSPGGWALGMARYSGNLFKWYRMFALIPRHSLQLSRDEIVLGEIRRLDPMESLQLFEDQFVVHLEAVANQPDRDLSLSRQSLMGLSSWLEGAPIGHRYEAS